MKGINLSPGISLVLVSFETKMNGTEYTDKRIYNEHDLKSKWYSSRKII